MKNRLVLIGWLGCKKAYLNVGREDAIARYCAEEKEDPANLLKDDIVEEFEFEDTFGAYDAWSR